MPPEDHFFIKFSVVYFRMRFSDYGKMLGGVFFLGLMMSSVGIHVSAYLMPVFILTIFITSYIFAYFNRPKVEVKRILPPSPSAGEFVSYRVLVKNTGKFAVRDLFVCENPLPYGLYDAPEHPDCSNTIDWLEPDETREVTLVFKCKLRGVYTLPKTMVGTSFPSGLLRWPKQQGSSQKFFVFPKFITQANFNVPFKNVYQPGGIAVSSKVGDSNEFLSTRDYRLGDRLKDIHWASYARTGRLIIKEYVDEYFVRVGIFLDTQISRKDSSEIFEDRISLVAGIADAIAKKDYIIDLFAAGDELHHFQMGRALAHLENLLQLLACIDGVKKVDFKKLEEGLRPYISKLSSIVMVFGDWNIERENLCNVIEHFGVSIRVIIVKERPLSAQPKREVTLINKLDQTKMIK